MALWRPSDFCIYKSLIKNPYSYWIFSIRLYPYPGHKIHIRSYEATSHPCRIFLCTMWILDKKIQSFSWLSYYCKCKTKITFSQTESITPCGIYLMYCEFNFIQRSFKILTFPGFMWLLCFSSLAFYFKLFIWTKNNINWGH